MNIPEFSVSRRITITMVILIIILFGLYSIPDLGLDMLPDIEFPSVSVITTYEGSGPEEIESSITKPMEETLSMVSGLKNVTSTSSEGMSAIYLEFNWGVNLDVAAQDAREALSWVRDYMPDDADEPMVVKFNTANIPIIEYGVTGMGNTRELREYLDDNIKPQLEKLEGVASAFVMGGREREFQILVDPDKLKATNLSLNQLATAVQASNLNVSAGQVTVLNREYQIRTKGYYDSVEQMAATVVSVTADGSPVYLRDVASVVDGLKESRGFERSNGKPCVIIAVMKQSGTNTLKAVNRTKAELARLEKTLPSDVHFDLVFDQGEIIERSVASTTREAMVGGILAILVIFAFLRSIRPTITIALAIPLSVVTTFIAMRALGYTFNMMTLGGLALGIGRLIDDAVVVIENTFRQMELGKTRREAAIAGASEVGMAVTASTLTTVAVFLPMSLSQSIAGKLARPLSITICLALLASLFVAMSIIPAIASTFFKSGQKLGLESEQAGWLNWIHDHYETSLAWSLNHKGKILGGALLAFVLSVMITPMLGSDFIPRQDIPMSQLKVELPEGSPLEATDHIFRQIEGLFQERKEAVSVVSQAGESEGSKLQAAQGEGTPSSSKGQIFVKYVKKEERDKSVEQISSELRSKIPDLEGVNFKFEEISLFGSTNPISITLYGKDIDRLLSLSHQMESELKQVKGLKDINVSLKKTKPEVQVRIDREKAARLGLTPAQVATAVETAMNGKVISRFHTGSDEYDIRLRYQESYRGSLEAIRNINIASPLGMSVPLYQIATLEHKSGPVSITRKNSNRVVYITGRNVDRSLGEVAKDAEAAIARVKLPRGYFYDMGGSVEDMQTSSRELSKAFLAAILLVFMIMAAQFESLVQPLVIMLCMPLGYIGVIVGLAVMGKTVSVPAMMGMIILMGIVVSNGIVMIDFINRLRRAGQERTPAIIQGAVVRLRPILITSITAILGMLPMAVSKGQGSEMTSPMAVAVAFGLLFSTAMTLYVVPAAYALADELSIKVKRQSRRIVLGE